MTTRNQMAFLKVVLLGTLVLSACKLETKNPATISQEVPSVGSVSENPSSERNTLQVVLHYDYMVKMGAHAHSHAPSANAVQLLKDAYAEHGIELIVTSRAISEAEVITFEAPDACNGTDDVAQITELRRESLGEEDATTRYTVFAHHLECADEELCRPCPEKFQQFRGTGSSNQLSRNVAVTLGYYIDQEFEPTDYQVAGTWMHELGHIFGLEHGGADGVNRKPNHFSVMNYNYQFGILTTDLEGSNEITGRRLDYADVEYSSLDEWSLDETKGVEKTSHPLDLVIYRCAGSPRRFIAQGTPIDWDCDGEISTSAVEADINLDSLQDGLEVVNEWDIIKSSIEND